MRLGLSVCISYTRNRQFDRGAGASRVRGVLEGVNHATKFLFRVRLSVGSSDCCYSLYIKIFLYMQS